MRAIFALIALLSCGVLGAAEGYLSEEEISLFYQQGYLLKRQCLTRDEMVLLYRHVSSVIGDALDQIQLSDAEASDADQITYIDGARVVFKRRPDLSVSIARINGCSGMEPALLETVRSEKLVRTFFELLGTSDLEHLISQIHPKLPGDGVAYPRHRDIQFRKSFDPQWEDILGNGSYAICIISIDPMTPENGGLWIDRNNYPEPQGLEEDLVWIYAEPGDFLFMHPNLYHGSGPNLSANERKTLLTGFCAYGANHRPYPGAHVNARLTLTDEGEILTEPSPWSQTPCMGPIAGH